MIRIREFEEGVRFLFLEGSMPGTIHQCQGQEATAVGVCAALRRDDFITSTFRDHGHALAKGLTEQQLLDELFGASTGCCKGKGGSMHIGDMSKGMVPGIAIVGGGIPLAAGMALAFKMQKTDQVVACFFGDGAVAEGAFHEGLNMAAIWRLPVVFVCENNLYGASTRIDSGDEQHAHLRPRRRLWLLRRDGRRQRRRGGLRCGPARGGALPRRRGAGPARAPDLPAHRPLAARCLRLSASGGAQGVAGRDPIDAFAAPLQAQGSSNPAVERMRALAEQRFAETVERARAAPQPTVDDLETDVFAGEAQS